MKNSDKTFECFGIRDIGIVRFKLGKFSRYAVPVAMQADMLAQQLVNAFLSLRRILQQKRKEVFFFIFMVQRRGNVEILGNLADGLQIDFVVHHQLRNFMRADFFQDFVDIVHLPFKSVSMSMTLL